MSREDALSLAADRMMLDVLEGRASGFGSNPTLALILRRASASTVYGITTQYGVSTTDASTVLRDSGLFSSYLSYTTSLGACFDYTPGAQRDTAVADDRQSWSILNPPEQISILAYGVTDQVCGDQAELERQPCPLRTESAVRIGILSILVVPQCPRLVGAIAAGDDNNPGFTVGDSISLVFDRDTAMQQLVVSEDGTALRNVVLPGARAVLGRPIDIMEFDPPLSGDHVVSWTSARELKIVFTDTDSRSRGISLSDEPIDSIVSVDKYLGYPEWINELGLARPDGSIPASLGVYTERLQRVTEFDSDSRRRYNDSLVQAGPDLTGGQKMSLVNRVRGISNNCQASPSKVELRGNWGISPPEPPFPWRLVLSLCFGFVLLAVLIFAALTWYIAQRESEEAALKAAKDKAVIEREQNDRHVTRTRYVLHELKQPFASVVMGLDQMDETLQELHERINTSRGPLDRQAVTEANEEMQSTMRIMRSSSVAMHHIITDVLLMAQIEA